MVPPEPGPLPSPPGDLGERALPLRTIERSWFRFHAPGRAPVHFGRKAENRFNAPGGEFGVLYLAADPAGAFIEVFGRVSGPRVVTPGQLARRNLAEVRPPRSLRLVNLIGAGLARIGADARLFAGEHEVARRWTAALHWHPQAPDGILYPARHDPSRQAAAVFNRVKGKFRTRSLGRLDEQRNRALLAELLDRYGFGWIE